MSARELIANRWLNQLTGVVLAGAGIIVMSHPAPRVSLHCLQDAAVHRLAPIVRKTELGRQFLAVYLERDAACHRTI